MRNHARILRNLLCGVHGSGKRHSFIHSFHLQCPRLCAGHTRYKEKSCPSRKGNYIAMLCEKCFVGMRTGKGHWVEFWRRDRNQMKWGRHSKQKKIAEGMASWEDSETWTGMLQTWGGGMRMEGWGHGFMWFVRLPGRSTWACRHAKQVRAVTPTCVIISKGTPWTSEEVLFKRKFSDSPRW